jgi:ribose transport system permease protein
MFNNGSPVFEVSPWLEQLFYGSIAGVPLPLLYVLCFFAAAHWLMRWTRLGRSIYAVGGNPRAAHLSGIDVPLTQFIAFGLAGFMAAVGAVLMAARLNSGSPNYGAGLELQAIAAAVIGGASLAGGRGNVLATLLGALTITIVQNGLNLNAVSTSMQNVTTGLIILLAVGIDMWRNEIGRLLRRVLPSAGKTAADHSNPHEERMR